MRLHIASTIRIVAHVLVVERVSHQRVNHLSRVHLTELLNRSAININGTPFAVSAADLLHYLLFMLVESRSGLFIVCARVLNSV